MLDKIICVDDIIRYAFKKHYVGMLYKTDPYIQRLMGHEAATTPALRIRHGACGSICARVRAGTLVLPAAPAPALW